MHGTVCTSSVVRFTEYHEEPDTNSNGPGKSTVIYTEH